MFIIKHFSDCMHNNNNKYISNGSTGEKTILFVAHDIVSVKVINNFLDSFQQLFKAK